MSVEETISSSEVHCSEKNVFVLANNFATCNYCAVAFDEIPQEKFTILCWKKCEISKSYSVRDSQALN